MRRLVVVRGRGRRVTLTGDSTQDRVDRYGRRLAYVTTVRGDVGGGAVRVAELSAHDRRSTLSSRLSSKAATKRFALSQAKLWSEPQLSGRSPLVA